MKLQAAKIFRRLAKPTGSPHEDIPADWAAKIVLTRPDKSFAQH